MNLNFDTKDAFIHSIGNEHHAYFTIDEPELYDELKPPHREHMYNMEKILLLNQIRYSLEK